MVSTASATTFAALGRNGVERRRDGSRQTSGAGRRFAILLFPGFPMMAFSAVIEPLRAANALGAEPGYSWSTVAIDDKPVIASNGIGLNPDFALKEDPAADFIVVCSGGNADQLTARQPVNWIRRNLRRGAHLGSVADGAFYLARAGLLDDYACTLHWRSQPAFVEAFPHISLRRTVHGETPFIAHAIDFATYGREGILVSGGERRKLYQ